jgi:hypothetical protein
MKKPGIITLNSKAFIGALRVYTNLVNKMNVAFKKKERSIRTKIN